MILYCFFQFVGFLCLGNRGLLIQESDTANQFRGVIQIEHRVLAEIGELFHEPLAHQRVAVSVEIGSEVLHALVLLLVGCSIGDAGQELLHTIVGQVFELVVVVFFATLGLVLGGSAVGLAFDFQVGEILLQGIDQQLGLIFAEAVGDAQPGGIGEAPLADHGRQGLSGLLLAPGLLGGDDLAVLGVAAGPDAQDGGDLGHGRVDAAVPGQVVHGLQAEEDVAVVLVLPDLGHDLVEGQALVHQLADLLHHHRHLGTGGEGVENVDLPVGMLLGILPGSGLGGVEAAGEVPGDGDTEDHIRIAEGIQPFLGIGAGGAGLALVGAQVIDHAPDVQGLTVNVLLLTGDDLHGDGGIAQTLHMEDIGGGIGNDLIAHKIILLSAVFGWISSKYHDNFTPFDPFRQESSPGPGIYFALYRR